MELGTRIQPTPASYETLFEENDDLWVSLNLRCQEFETRLSGWHTDLESRYRRDKAARESTSDDETRQQGGDFSLYWFESSTLYRNLLSMSPARVFPLFICFPDPDIAQQLVLYWTCLLLMHSTIHIARNRFTRYQHINTPSQSHSHSHSQPVPQLLFTSLSPSEFSSPHNLALLIVQSLEYFLHPDMGLLGTNFVGFPLAVAQGYFEHIGARDREGRWFAVLFQRIRDMRSGLGVFLDDMARGEAVRLVRP